MVVERLALSPHSLNPQVCQEPFCVEFGLSLIGDSKLPTGVNISLFLCVSPVIDWRPVQDVSCLLPNDRLAVSRLVLASVLLTEMQPHNMSYCTYNYNKRLIQGTFMLCVCVCV